MSFCGQSRSSVRRDFLDPQIEVRPVEGQIDDLIGEVNKEVERGS